MQARFTLNVDGSGSCLDTRVEGDLQLNVSIHGSLSPGV